MMTSKIEQIRTLNDRLRQNLSTDIGTAVITTGVAALGDEAVARIVKTVAVTRFNVWCFCKLRTVAEFMRLGAAYYRTVDF